MSGAKTERKQRTANSEVRDTGDATCGTGMDNEVRISVMYWALPWLALILTMPYKKVLGRSSEITSTANTRLRTALQRWMLWS